MKAVNLFPKVLPRGSLHIQYHRCGYPKCRCKHGLLHGPYVYLRWRESGRQRKRYIPMSRMSDVLADLQAARAATPRPSVLRQILHELNDAPDR
jgi:Family of unknown function (DUF6788)